MFLTILLHKNQHNAIHPGHHSRHVSDDGRDALLAVHAYRADRLFSKERGDRLHHHYLTHYLRLGGHRGSSSCSWLELGAPLIPRWVIDGVPWWNIGCRWDGVPWWNIGCRWDGVPWWSIGCRWVSTSL